MVSEPIWLNPKSPDYVLIVTGTRDLGHPTRQIHIREAIETFKKYPETLFQGGARGVDTWMKAHFSEKIGADNVLEMAADWKKHGKIAGPIRNQEMLDTAIIYANALELPLWFIAFPAPESIGTFDMIRRLESEKIPGLVVDLRGYPGHETNPAGMKVVSMKEEWEKRGLAKPVHRVHYK